MYESSMTYGLYHLLQDCTRLSIKPNGFSPFSFAHGRSYSVASDGWQGSDYGIWVTIRIGNSVIYRDWDNKVVDGPWWNDFPKVVSHIKEEIARREIEHFAEISREKDNKIADVAKLKSTKIAAILETYNALKDGNS